MANSISIQIDLEGKDAINTLKAIDKGVKQLGKDGTKSINSMTGAMQVFQGVVGARVLLKSIDLIGRSLKEGAKNALEFGGAVAEINSIAPRTAAETLALKQALLGLSNEFGGRAQKQAKAFYNIVSAGVKGTAKQLAVLETANKAAVAGLVDIDTSARVLVSSVNSYAASGLTASDASDILFNTVKEGITTFTELSGSIGTVAPIASAAGVKFSELGGTLAFLTKSGISTSEAATGLRAILTGVIKPSEEAGASAKALSLDFSTAAIRAKGFAGFLKDVTEKTGGSEVALAKLFPNVRALGPILQIASANFEEFQRILDGTANSTGATDKAFQTITKSAAFQFEKLTTQLTNFPTAILTNFEEPLADGLKAVNQFVSSQGILLIPQAVGFVLESFQDLLNTKDDLVDFFDFVGEAASGAVNAITGVDNVSTESLTEKLGGLESNLKSLQKTSETTKERLAGLSDLGGRAGDTSQIEANLEKRSEAIREQIALTKIQLSAFQQADLEEAKITDTELKRREARNAKILEFRQTLEDATKEFEANADARKAKELAIDEQLAKDKVTAAIEGENNKFNAIQELKAAQKELEAESVEEERLAKELATEEEFLFLEENLGRATALRELNRIQSIDNEKKRLTEIKKLQKKATDNEQKSSLFQLNFDKKVGAAKVASQKQTLNTIASLQSSGNAVLFRTGQAAALTLAGMNTAQAVTSALKDVPFPFNFAAAGAVGAAGAIQIANIASSKPPTSAGSFQSGGIIDGASQTGDQLTANVNGGEAIFNRRQQQNLFNAVNDGSLGGGGGSTNNISITSPTGDIPQETIDSLIEQINDRTEFGNRTLGAA